MKVILDTNAFYDFMCISKNSHINHDVFRELLSDPKNEVTIPTTTLYEFLIKYEQRIDIIKYGISFIVQHVKKIHSESYLPLTKEIKSLPKCSDKKIYEVIKDCKEKRIETEARFASFFVEYLLLQYTLSYIFEKRGQAMDESIELKLFQSCAPKIFQDTQQQMVQALRDGYIENNAQPVAEDRYNSILEDRLSTWMAFLEFIDNKPNPNLTVEEAFKDFVSFFDNSRHVYRFYNSNDNINKWIAKYDNQSNKIASTGLLAVLRAGFEAKGVHGIQVEYMQWKLSSMSQQIPGETPSKFHKNDVLDMLILTVLNDDDSVLISFDKNVRRFIAHIKNKSENYINRICLISS
jgi:predicted nucleic acid-binding protein/nuclear transport factor 2 (NTF2) superfamily protein